MYRFFLVYFIGSCNLYCWSCIRFQFQLAALWRRRCVVVLRVEFSLTSNWKWSKKNKCFRNSQVETVIHIYVQLFTALWLWHLLWHPNMEEKSFWGHHSLIICLLWKCTAYWVHHSRFINVRWTLNHFCFYTVHGWNAVHVKQYKQLITTSYVLLYEFHWLLSFAAFILQCRLCDVIVLTLCHITLLGDCRTELEAEVNFRCSVSNFVTFGWSASCNFSNCIEGAMKYFNLKCLKFRENFEFQDPSWNF